MASLKGSQTEANLREAFAREASANHRYLWFAEQADVDGRPEVAAIFRHLAAGETGHAFGHLELLADLGDPLTGSQIADTTGQIEAALEAERLDATEVYPTYARVAAEEGFAEIATWLENVAKAEHQHAERLERYLADRKADRKADRRADREADREEADQHEADRSPVDPQTNRTE